MGELISFPDWPRHGVMKPGTDVEAAEANVNSMTRKLATTVDLLDQIVAKFEQMNRVLPTHLLSRFEPQQLQLRNQIKQAHLKVALLPGFSKD